MKTILARGVNDAYCIGVNHLRQYGERADSRAGEVIVLPTPLITVYARPEEHVLFCPWRNANPFFHLFESLWMLHGRCDADWLDQFVSDFSSRFAESNGVMHGAYGWRWRVQFGMDQIDYAVRALRSNPNDRRVVIQMWDAETDLGRDYMDLPCNTHIYPRIREGYLDLTVCCRSNDAIWGAYGSNAVHFAILLEYMAAKIGCKMGMLYQFSNNFHAYTATIPEKVAIWDQYKLYPGHYDMVEYPDSWDDDLDSFMEDPVALGSSMNPWFSDVAWPMWMANRARLDHKYSDAIELLSESCAAPDWKMAGINWLKRLEKKHGHKEDISIRGGSEEIPHVADAPAAD